MIFNIQIFNLIKTIPSRIMLVCRKGEEINNINELNNKNISTIENSSMHNLLKKIEKENDIKLNYHYITEIPNWFTEIEENKVDYTARDANMTIYALKEYSGLNISIPLGDVQNLAWAVSKENIILASILDKYLNYMRDSDQFNKYWIEDYGITLVEYLRLLDL